MRNELQLAKINEAYHRKQMEYFQEEIKILQRNQKKEEPLKRIRKGLNKLRSRN